MRLSQLVLTVMLIVVAAPLHAATKPVWGKGARAFFKECSPSHPACTLAYVPSPDQRYSIAIRLRNDVLTLTLNTGTKAFSVPLSQHVDEEYWVATEILWAPDSSAFSLTGNPNGYTNETRLYRVTSHGLKLADTASLMQEMATTYPPCVGMANPNVDFCNSIRDGSGYNYATFAWTGKHTAVLMAEVVSTGNYGKNLGQIRGYEFDVAAGKIVRVMDAKELQRRWQHRMAWTLRIPEKP